MGSRKDGSDSTASAVDKDYGEKVSQGQQKRVLGDVGSLFADHVALYLCTGYQLCWDVSDVVCCCHNQACKMVTGQVSLDTLVLLMRTGKPFRLRAALSLEPVHGALHLPNAPKLRLRHAHEPSVAS